MISRILQGQLKENLKKDKVIILYGARQVGKTTLLKAFESNISESILWINGDLAKYHSIFSAKSKETLTDLIDQHTFLIIDEAQNLPEIGVNLKILHDEFPGLKIIATGSSALQIASKTKEALTGRTVSLHLFPISIAELLRNNSAFDVKNDLHNYLLYGMYPEVIMLQGVSGKKMHLEELSSAYLYKIFCN